MIQTKRQEVNWRKGDWGSGHHGQEEADIGCFVSMATDWQCLYNSGFFFSLVVLFSVLFHLASEWGKKWVWSKAKWSHLTWDKREHERKRQLVPRGTWEGRKKNPAGLSRVASALRSPADSTARQLGLSRQGRELHQGSGQALGRLPMWSASRTVI